jgi:hypothetical protein
MNLIDDLWFKSQDRLKLYYLASWSIKKEGVLKNWAWSFTTTFLSQFSEGFKGRSLAERRIPWSNFMAPGTLNAGLGLTYTSPNPRLPFVVTMNPISGNALFVLDDRLSDDRRVQLGIPVARDAEARLINHKLEGGSTLDVDFNRTFAFGKEKGFTLQYNTTLTSFYGWITHVSRRDPIGDAPAPAKILPTLNWTNSLTVNPLKFLGLEFRTTMKYDRSQIDKVQMQYYLRVALTYRYLNK